VIDTHKQKMCNHLENNFLIGEKKGLFQNVTEYFLKINKNPFETIPLTFLIQHGSKDPELEKFKTMFNLYVSKG